MNVNICVEEALYNMYSPPRRCSGWNVRVICPCADTAVTAATTKAADTAANSDPAGFPKLCVLRKTWTYFWTSEMIFPVASCCLKRV